MKRLLPPLLSVVLLAGSACIPKTAEVLEKPLANDPMGVTIHRLDNGLTVYISPNRDKPRFTAWIAVRAGSRFDPPNSTGLAHYLEHMLFKGSTKMGTLDFKKEAPHLKKIAELYAALRNTEDETERKRIFKEIDAETQKSSAYAIPNELDSVYATLGVSGVNAFTGQEMTVYISDVPKNQLAAWARLEADRMTNPQFRLFYPELEAVYEEKNGSLDNPESRVRTAMARGLFPTHPYGTQTTIGHVSHLKNPAYGDMSAYYDRWYVPNNVAIILTGDIDPKTALPVIEREFGSWASKPLPKPPSASISKIAKRHDFQVKADSPESGIVIGWRTAGLHHPDRAALEVMDWLTDNATSGILNIELILTQKLPEAGSYPQQANEGGAWILHGTARQGQSLDEVESLLLGVVNKLKKGEFKQSDIDAIVVNSEIIKKRSLEANQARAYELMSAFTSHTRWSSAVSHIDTLGKVRREDVIRVANKYLNDSMVVVRRVPGPHKAPKISKPEITPVKIDPTKRSAFAKSILEMPADPINPEWIKEGADFVRSTLPAGEMIAVKNTRNDLFTVTYRFEVGHRQEPMLCFALRLLDRAGAGGQSPAGFKKKLYSWGTSINSTCGPETAQIQVSGVDRNMERSLAAMKTWLASPMFNDDTIQALAANTISRRKDQLGDTRFLASALGSYAMRADKSRFLNMASNEELQKATVPAMRALLTGLSGRAHRTLYYGPRSAEAAAKKVEFGENHAATPAREPVTYRRTDKPTIYFTHKAIAQARIQFLFPKPPLDPSDRAVSRLYSQYMSGGMQALVFQEIREARGLAYAAWAFHSAGARQQDEAAMQGGIGTQADKTVTALSEMMKLLQNTPMEDVRFKAASSSLVQEIRTERVDARSVAGRVLWWTDLGEESDPGPREWKAIQETSIDAFRTFAGTLGKGPLVISILGDRDRIDLKTLAKTYEVVEVAPESLVSF